MASEGMDRNLALEMVRVTEAAALATSRFMGLGDEQAADEAAVDAVQQALNRLPITGTVVIGEGVAESAPKLHVGETVGQGGPAVDIALDPLEGSTICAKGAENAVAVVAVGEAGCFLDMGGFYMEKIAVGPDVPPETVHLAASPEENLKALAAARNCAVGDLLVCLLDRPRHEDLIARVREAGARIKLIEDGDVSGVIATALPETGISLYLGSGGGPEGVLAAAALRCLGGHMQGRVLLRHEDDRRRAAEARLPLDGRVYTGEEMAAGAVTFAATGVTDGTLLRGVRWHREGATTHSLVLRSCTGTVRRIEARHDFRRKTGPRGHDDEADHG